MEYKLEKNIPLPTKIERGRKEKYPLKAMHVGESFVVKAIDIARVRSAIGMFEGRHIGTHFVTGKVNEKLYRVWKKA